MLDITALIALMGRFTVRSTVLLMLDITALVSLMGDITALIALMGHITALMAPMMTSPSLH